MFAQGRVASRVEVFAGRDADRLAELSGKTRARHAGLGSHRFKRPGPRRFGVDRTERLVQSRIAKPGQQATVDQLQLDGMAQHLDHQHFGQAIDHGVVTTSLTEGLVEQQLLGQCQTRHARQRHDQAGGQGAQQRVLVADAELDRCADQFSGRSRLAVEPVQGGPREKHHARFVEDDAPALLVGDHQRAVSQQMQVAASVCGVEVGNATQGAAVKDAGTQLEALQEGGETVDHDETNGISIETESTQSSRFVH